MLQGMHYRNYISDMLQKNEVIHWGFDNTKVETGKELPDMKDWDADY